MQIFSKRFGKFRLEKYYCLLASVDRIYFLETHAVLGVIQCWFVSYNRLVFYQLLLSFDFNLTAHVDPRSKRSSKLTVVGCSAAAMLLRQQSHRRQTDLLNGPCILKIFATNIEGLKIVCRNDFFGHILITIYFPYLRSEMDVY